VGFSVFPPSRAVRLRLLEADEVSAAAPPGLDPPGLGTARFGQREPMWAEGDASHGTVHAGALVSAARAEDLPVLVNVVAVLARSSIRFG